jgi:hypothetical protein
MKRSIHIALRPVGPAVNNGMWQQNETKMSFQTKNKIVCL